MMMMMMMMMMMLLMIDVLVNVVPLCLYLCPYHLSHSSHSCPPCPYPYPYSCLSAEIVIYCCWMKVLEKEYLMEMLRLMMRQMMMMRRMDLW